MEPKIRKTTIVKQYLTPLKPDDPKTSEIKKKIRLEIKESLVNASNMLAMIKLFNQESNGDNEIQEIQRRRKRRRGRRSIE